jgi:hypothetical protein
VEWKSRRTGCEAIAVPRAWFGSPPPPGRPYSIRLNRAPSDPGPSGFRGPACGIFVQGEEGGECDRFSVDVGGLDAKAVRVDDISERPTD